MHHLLGLGVGGDVRNVSIPSVTLIYLTIVLSPLGLLATLEQVSPPMENNGQETDEDRDATKGPEEDTGTGGEGGLKDETGDNEKVSAETEATPEGEGEPIRESAPDTGVGSAGDAIPELGLESSGEKIAEVDVNAIGEAILKMNLGSVGDAIPEIEVESAGEASPQGVADASEGYTFSEMDEFSGRISSAEFTLSDISPWEITEEEANVAFLYERTRPEDTSQQSCAVYETMEHREERRVSAPRAFVQAPYCSRGS